MKKKKKKKLGETNELECATIAISSSESDKLEKKLQIKDIEKIGSIAYKIALVAKGKIDATEALLEKVGYSCSISNLGSRWKDLINGDEISYNTQNLKILH